MRVAQMTIITVIFKENQKYLYMLWSDQKIFRHFNWFEKLLVASSNGNCLPLFMFKQCRVLNEKKTLIMFYSSSVIHKHTIFVINEWFQSAWIVKFEFFIFSVYVCVYEYMGCYDMEGRFFHPVPDVLSKWMRVIYSTRL